MSSFGFPLIIRRILLLDEMMGLIDWFQLEDCMYGQGGSTYIFGMGREKGKGDMMSEWAEGRMKTNNAEKVERMQESRNAINRFHIDWWRLYSSFICSFDFVDESIYRWVDIWKWQDFSLARLEITRFRKLLNRQRADSDSGINLVIPELSISSITRNQFTDLVHDVC